MTYAAIVRRTCIWDAEYFLMRRSVFFTCFGDGVRPCFINRSKVDGQTTTYTATSISVNFEI